MLHLGFPWMHPKLITIAYFPLLKARWTYFVFHDRSMFHDYDQLAAIFLPSIDSEDVMSHIEALTKVTQQALDDFPRTALFNTKMSLMRKATFN